ncbi:MAG: hypothetical protein ACR2QE_10975 [Acidimicrobiales bacterium]
MLTWSEHRRRTAFIVVGAISMLAAACGSSSESPAPDTTAGVTTSGLPIAELTRPELPAELAALEPGLDALGQSCGTAAEWTAAAAALSDGLVAVADDAPVLDSDVAEAAYLRLEQDVYFTPCNEEASAASDEERADALEQAGRLSAALDSLNLVLQDRPVPTSGELWFHGDHLNHTIEMESVITEDGGVDVITMGSSIAAWGFDPAQLGETLGARAWNVGMGGLNPITLLGWDEQIRTTLPEHPETVVLAVGTFEDFRCNNSLLNDFRSDTEARAVAFESLSFLDHVPGHIRMVGGVPESYDGPLLAASRDDRFPAGARGRIEHTPPSLGTTAASREVFESSFRDPERCPANREAIADWVMTWASNGARTVVVAMPAADELLAMYPEGEAAHEVVLADYEAVVAEAGGEFLDLTEAVDEDSMRDLTHVNADGREVVTGALAQHLGTSP